MNRQTFGARFLDEFRHAGGSTNGWPEAVLASVAAADRQAFIALLAIRRSLVAAELIVAARTAEPEVLARRAVARAAQGGGDAAMLMLWFFHPSG